jgi:alkylation response protein AidB-like acyl-CoA dehydrogenase
MQTSDFAPLDRLADFTFLLEQVHHVDQNPWLTGILTRDVRQQILTQAEALFFEVVEPLRRIGDREGARFVEGRVYAPAGFHKAYQAIVTDGWHASGIPEAEGGSGLSPLLGQFIEEMGAGANPALHMYYGFAAPAARVIRRFGAPWLADLIIPHLISGGWTATMCLTEPQAGTDLAQVASRAVPAGDGCYHLSGTKIFISAGDHDLAENIIHVVLARVHDPSGGTQSGLPGLGVFIVPKLRFEDDGDNGVTVIGIEQKMGLHGNPTCTLRFEQAKGYRLSPGMGSAAGMAPLFDMMNQARLSTATGALGTAFAATGMAYCYACERRSGFAAARMPDGRVADPIIRHPDVERMLLSACAFVEGTRALLSWVALLLEEQEYNPDPVRRSEAGILAHLLPPILKAFITDQAFLVCDDCLQVFGGHGYIQETGIEQLLRDCRVSRIYEGANGIQAHDLVMRRMVAADGRGVELLVEQISLFVASHAADMSLAPIMEPLADAIGELAMTRRLCDHHRQHAPRILLECSADVVKLFGVILVGWRSAVSVIAARSCDQDLFNHKFRLAAHWALRHLPLTRALLAGLQRNGAPMG